MKVKEESEKAGLKLSIREIKSCHLVPHFKSYWWRYNGIQDSFSFLDFQHHCGQWLKPWMCKTLAPWMKSYDQCGHRLKSRVITDKDPNSQSYGFSRSHLWSWEMDNTRTECQITEALQLSGWRILLTVLWTAEVSNNSVMKEINWDTSQRDWSWMWRANSLAIWGQEPNHWERPWSWERFSAGGEGNQRGQFSSVQFSHSVISDTLWFHGLQHTRSLCPHQLAGFIQMHAHWVSDAIKPSHPLSSPSPPTLNLSQHQGLFMSQFFASGGQSIGVSAPTSVLPMNIQDLFPLGWTGWTSLQSKGLSRVFSSTTVKKHQFFSTQLSL